MNAEGNESTRDKLALAQRGDARAREELVRENIALVKYIVKRFNHRGAEYDDLFQYGCLGLLKAIDRFDPAFAVRFSTYAVPVIMGEIRRYLRDDGPIHVSRTIHERARRIAAYIQRFEQENRRQPDIGEIAEALDLEKGDVLMAMNSGGCVRSLNEPVGGDGELRLMDVLGSAPMEAVETRLTLKKLLKDLSDDERALIVRRYFKSHTQTEIARDLGVSQVQVSRMESRIIKRMRAMAGADAP